MTTGAALTDLLAAGEMNPAWAWGDAATSMAAGLRFASATLPAPRVFFDRATCCH